MEKLKELIKQTEAEKTESVGNRINGYLADLRDQLQSAGSGSQSITPADTKALLAAVDECKAKLKKILRGKGLVGW